MSYYESQSWPNNSRQQSWEQPAPPARSATSSTVQRDDAAAFSSQFEDVDRAIDNLVKSGKLFGAAGRRDSMPVMGGPRQMPNYDPRMGGPMPQRHHSVSDYDPMRSQSGSNLQNYYANQRYQPRPNDAEQMMQAKRRMAAQRERELRNYHQEQQYNRTLLTDVSTQAKSERSMSPAMHEEDRRDLIARQHRALYGNDNAPAQDNASYSETGQAARPMQQGGSGPNSAGAARGSSPLAFDPFGMKGQNGPNESGHMSASEHSNQQANAAGPSPIQQQQPQRSRANSNSSPSSNPNSFSLFDNAAQQSSRTSASSPGGSPPRQAKANNGGGVAPIGTRPTSGAQAQAPNPALNKRSTTPLPSPLSYGFASNDTAENNNERSTSAASNPTAGSQDQGVGLGWGSNSGVWGNKSSLGVQASVWG
ncbi:MAG: hypothetical protein M1817_000907 [Caeruleum heppii]|nr:MAG: hypothetical protein M1817_000907 [Caeruleum heppii]